MNKQRSWTVQAAVLSPSQIQVFSKHLSPHPCYCLRVPSVPSVTHGLGSGSGISLPLLPAHSCPVLQRSPVVMCIHRLWILPGVPVLPWSTSSLFPLLFSPLPLWCFLPFLRQIFTETPPAWLRLSHTLWLVCWSCVQNRQPWPLLTEITPAAETLPWAHGVDLACMEAFPHFLFINLSLINVFLLKNWDCEETQGWEVMLSFNGLSKKSLSELLILHLVSWEARERKEEQISMPCSYSTGYCALVS